MATTASVCSWTKTTTTSALLLLAPPALAQSQGGTGVGGALSDVQAGYASVRQGIDEVWDGEAGRIAKYGIGLAGLGAALMAARDAVAGVEGKVSFAGGSPQVTIGVGGGGNDDGMSPTTTTTTTTATSP